MFPDLRTATAVLDVRQVGPVRVVTLSLGRFLLVCRHRLFAHRSYYWLPTGITVARGLPAGHTPPARARTACRSAETATPSGKPLDPTASRHSTGVWGRRLKSGGPTTARVTVLLGRETGHETGRERAAAGPTARLGHALAPDGSHGVPVRVDVDRPHAGLVVGKRGTGKSHTLGVLAEELARADGVAPVVVDPMGAFEGVTAGARGVTASTVDPVVRPGALSPRAWCRALSVSPERPVGGLVWAAATAADTLAGMRAAVDDREARPADRRAARNHIDLAADWGVFGPEGLTAADLAGGGVTVLDGTGLARAPLNVLTRAVADALYRARLEAAVRRLPWLLVDEAHALFEGVGGPGLERLVTRGRAPGVSLVAATQRPSALPGVLVSQADLLVAHHLTSAADVEALRAARPTYLPDPGDRLPGGTGEALVVDDTTETVHTVRVRERDTPHGGESPRASEG